MAMKRIRVGIIGQGRSGCNIHAHLMTLLREKFDLVAVADPIAERVDDARKRFGCRGFSHYREMAHSMDLELIVNATPSHLHVPLTAELLGQGHNVLCEKPLASQTTDVDRLVETAAETGAVLAVFQQSRFAPYFQKVREVIDSKVLGRVVMIRCAFTGFARRWDWQTLQQFNGGNLLNTGPHPLDQALQLFGTAEEPRVFCLMDRANTFGDAEDHVKLILFGERSPTIDLEISSCSAYPVSTYRVYGTRGGLDGTTTHVEWKYYLPEESPEQHLITEPLPDRAYCNEEITWHEDSWDVPDEQSNLFDTIGISYYNDLYEVLTAGKEPVVKVSDVRRQIAVIEECHRQESLSRMTK